MRESHAVGRVWERATRTLRSYERERVDTAQNTLEHHRWIAGVHFVLDASWTHERWSEECMRIEKFSP